MEPRSPDILDLDLAELEQSLVSWGVEAYRARQIFRWVYQRGARDFSGMTDLNAGLRERFAAEYRIGRIEPGDVREATDGTRKLLYSLQDALAVEGVLIPEQNRLTLCVSTQVGCALGCRFCLTARRGFARNLTPGEIVGQVLAAGEVAGGGRISNLVFMGMGEPLANLDAVKRAIRILTADQGLNFSPRRITVSTVGLIPEMRELLEQTDVRLAVSLHAARQELRESLVPAARRYPLADLIEACRHLPVKKRDRITFEIVLLKGVNDGEAEARQMAKLLAGLRCKVNLIPFNPFPGTPFERPEDAAVERFAEVLRAKNFTALVRKGRGIEIGAACGQLGRTKREIASNEHPETGPADGDRKTA